MQNTNCALCHGSGWIIHDKKNGGFDHVVHALADLGTPADQIQSTMQEIREKSIVRDEGTTPWYCSVPCIQCNKNAQIPAPEMHYYRLWSDSSRVVMVALDNGNGQHLTRAEFDNLEDSLEEE
uniref:NLP/P60 family protein dipeptidyl-peptidase n=1 Tax=Clandestinovirus TaxID=2831644 RepID=A0A8F8KL91_9VIRU|nr:NLP/P60 family protein dipeptidyl-peptidase [Clandestinovirus]